MAGRCNEIVHRIVARAAQRPNERFCLAEMAHPVVTPVHDIDRDVPQSGDMVENIVVIAVDLAVGTEKPPITVIM